MKTVTLIMKRASLAQGLMKRLDGDAGLRLHYRSDYAGAAEAVREQRAETVLLEAAELGQYDTTRCLSLCADLRRTAPESRLLLMCPEQDRRGVEQVIRAKQSGLIDDFVFYDVTMDYLITALKAL